MTSYSKRILKIEALMDKEFSYGATLGPWVLIVAFGKERCVFSRPSSQVNVVPGYV